MSFGDTMWLGTQSATAADDRMFALGWMVQGVAPAVGADPANALHVFRQTGFTVGIAPGWAYVQGDDSLNQGVYASYNSASFNLLNARGAPASGSRIDIVVARVFDSESVTGGSPSDQMFFDWAYGTASSSASLTNPSTWPTLPPTSVALGATKIASTDTSIAAGNVLDLRKLAGPGIWGEDGHRYRLGVDGNGILKMEQVQ